ncbi:MAG TPA: hypothetical protein VLF59_05750 [Candidatus Saccharimonadales bacterium]|nr:hypothetical protein [Candidatus Saccharimonadales bacterium]
MSKNNLYEEVVTITYQYLGPAADRFVIRQIRNHLQKDPAALRRKDLRQLIDWIEIAMRLISNDHAVIDQYIAELELLTLPNHNNHPVLPDGKETHH